MSLGKKNAFFILLFRRELYHSMPKKRPSNPCISYKTVFSKLTKAFLLSTGISNDLNTAFVIIR